MSCLLSILRPGDGKITGVEKLEQKRSDLHGRVKLDIYAQLKWNLRRERLQGNHQKERVKNIEANGYLCTVKMKASP